MKTSMSAKRLLSLFAALALVVVVLLTVQARITAANVVSNPQLAAADQAEARGLRYNSSSPQAAVDRAPARDPRYNSSSPQAAVDRAPARDPRYNPSSPQAAVDQAGSSLSQP